MNLAVAGVSAGAGSGVGVGSGAGAGAGAGAELRDPHGSPATKLFVCMLKVPFHRLQWKLLMDWRNVFPVIVPEHWVVASRGVGFITQSLPDTPMLPHS